jgi:hypothetical protein
MKTIRELVKTLYKYAKDPVEMAGVQTFVSPTKGRTDESPEGNENERPYASKNKVRGIPLPSEHKKDRTQKTPGNHSFNVPSGTEDGTKVPIRTKSTPGEDYGHPYKENVYPRRTLVSESVIPSSSERQKNQMGEASRYYEKYYQRNKKNIIEKSKQRYKRKRNDPREKKRRELYKDKKIKDKFERVPTGGYSDPSERTKDWRKEQKKAGIARKQKRRKRRSVKDRMKWKKWYRKNKQKLKIKSKKYYTKNKHRLKKLRKDRYKNPRRYKIRRTAQDPINFWINLSLDIWSSAKFVSFDPDFCIVYFHTENGSLRKLPLEIFVERALFDEDQDVFSFYEILDSYYEDPRTASYTFHRDQDSPTNLNKERLTKGVPRLDPYKDIPEGTTTWVSPSPSKSNKKENLPSTELDLGTVHDSGSGSARVIPTNKDYANKLATTIAEIESKTSQSVFERAKKVTVSLKRALRKKGLWVFQANDHTVKIRAIPKDRSKKVSLSDVKVSCSCGFWRWQGPEHWAVVGNYLLGKKRGTASYPKIMDVNEEHRCCKHVLAVFNLARNYKVASANSQNFDIRREVLSFLRSKNSLLSPLLEVEKNYPRPTLVDGWNLDEFEALRMKKEGLIYLVKKNDGWEARMTKKGWKYLRDAVDK